jgi:hypothetical protein
MDGEKFILSTVHYIILIATICSVYWVVISLIGIIQHKKRLRAKKKTWRKLNEVSERLKVEKSIKVWESLGKSSRKN